MHYAESVKKVRPPFCPTAPLKFSVDRKHSYQNQKLSLKYVETHFKSSFNDISHTDVSPPILPCLSSRLSHALRFLTPPPYHRFHFFSLREHFTICFRLTPLDRQLSQLFLSSDLASCFPQANPILPQSTWQSKRSTHATSMIVEAIPPWK